MARIIYVEDDDLVGDIVQKALSDAGHLIGVINHGSLAFDSIVYKRPDLIILDCSLPGMTGIEILKAVRANSDIYLTPVVMLTAIDNLADINRAMEAGANDYIVKPFETPDLVERINAVLGNTLYRAKVSDRLREFGMRGLVRP